MQATVIFYYALPDIKGLRENIIQVILCSSRMRIEKRFWDF